MDALPERFGKYHVLERLARGGMAEVYKVKTVGIAGFEKVQALKRILPAYVREPRFLRSFVDEARIAVELNHRNIVQVFDFGKAEGELFLAMELIEGIDLRTAVEAASGAGFELPIPLACYLLGEVAAGLDYAHRKTDGFGQPLRIVHCDVSPQNIMLSNEGYVKILDFGVARAQFSTVTQNRRLRGKPRYMAPEQTRGEPPTPATDVFALGIIAWELVTGRPLFTGNSLPAILAAVRQAKSPRVDALVPDVPAALADAIATALSREPADRGTAADLHEAFARQAQRYRGGATARALAAWLREATPEPTTPGQSLDEVDEVYAIPGIPSVIEDGEATPRQRMVRTPVVGTRTRGAEGSTPRRGAEGSADVERRDADGADPAAPTPRARARARPGDRSARRADTREGSPPVPLATGARGSQPANPARPAGKPATASARADSVVDGVPEPLPPYPSSSTAEGVIPDRLPMPETGSAPAAVTPAPARLATEPPAHDTGPTLTTAPMLAGFSPRAFESIDEHAGAPAALMEKRRVVAICALVEGGDDRARGELLRLCADLAYKRGAIINASTDDSLVAVFGLEVAGEDDVASAMSYALDAIDLTEGASAAAERRSRRHTGDDVLRGVVQPINVRLAARAGVVARRRKGGGYQLVGDPAGETRALARTAEPGKPLLAGGAGRLSSAYYQFREVPSRHRRRGMRVLELVGPRSFDERDRALHGRRGRFVGRGEQLAALHEALADAVASGQRVTAAVIGPSGIGKSRLVAEFVAQVKSAREPRPVVLVVAAAPDANAAPFSLLIDLVQVMLNLPPGRGEAAQSRLTRRLRHVLEEVLGERDVDEVVGAFELAMELRDGALISGLGAVPDLRDRLAGALRTLRRALLPTAHPVIAVIEDWHFADHASAEVLRTTIEKSPEGAELDVITTRPVQPNLREGAGRAGDRAQTAPGAAPPTRAETERSEPSARTRGSGELGVPFGPALPDALDLQLPLEELSGDELDALIRDRLDDAASEDAVALVGRRAGGNPLLVEQLAQAVREIGPDQIPSSVRALVLSRVDRLRAPTKAALQYAAVIGPVVRVCILEELLGPEVHEELEALCDEGFLRRTQPGGDAADDELAFSRGLVREVVYESLAATARRDTHAKVGALLAMRFRAERGEPPAVIAEHLEAGGELQAASAFWLRAGRIALAAFDAQAAVARLSRTLELEDKIGEPASDAAKNRRMEALFGREHAYRLLGDHDACARDLARLEQMCERNARRLADVKNRAALRHLRMGDYAAAVRMSKAAQRIASDAGDERACGEALRIRGEAYQRQGQYDRGLEVIRGARDIFRRLGAAVDETKAMIGEGRIHIMRARYEAALAAYEPIIAQLERAGDVWLERIVRNHLAVIYMSLGEFEKAMSSARRSLEICRRYGDRAREGDNLSMCGIILSELGCFDEAGARLAEALAVLAETRSQWSRADCLVYAGVNASRLGDHDAALAQIERALRTAREIKARYVEVNAMVALAGVRLSRNAIGDVERAAQIAGEAARLAGASTLRGPEIQALSRQAEATWQMGDVDAALALADRAVELLDVQRHVEGSEIEILYAHYRILRARGDDRAHTALARATEEFERQLATIETPAWRTAFRERVAVNAALLAESAFAGGA